MTDKYLGAYGSYERGVPECGVWDIYGGISENFKERFRALVSRAGLELACPPGTLPENYWLHSLFQDLLENNSELLFAAQRGVDGVIKRVCEGSATFCARLERKALTNAMKPSISKKIKRLKRGNQAPLIPHGWKKGIEQGWDLARKASDPELIQINRRIDHAAKKHDDRLVGKGSTAETLGCERAKKVAMLIGELNALRPQMQVPEDDYPKLASKHQGYLVFKICKTHPPAAHWVKLLPERRSIHTIAYEIAAVACGVSSATIETAWKRFKPNKRKRNKPDKSGTTEKH